MISDLQHLPDHPIGVFDSGVGGLSVLSHLHRQLPREELFYIADSAFIPYGDKPLAVIRERVLRMAEVLHAWQVKALVVACNTATAAAIHELRSHYPQLPIIGMEPGLKPAIGHSRRGKVGILATAGTLRSDKFATLMAQYGAGAEVLLQPCPGLVEQVEKGEIDTQATETLLRGYLAPLLAAGVDAIVLGCTHYPFLLPLIRRLVGSAVHVIDTGEAVARQVERRLMSAALLNRGESGKVRFYSTRLGGGDSALMARLWGGAVELHAVDPDSPGYPISATTDS